MPKAYSLTTLNESNQDAFTDVLGSVFEHSPWIAELAFAAKPFASVHALHQAMVDVVKQASKEDQLALLRLHPELAGKAAQKGELTAASTDEQSSVGLNALSDAELRRVKQLNSDYRNKFGFPFIIAVRQNTKDGIFAQWEKRLANAPESEFQICLEQVYAIAQIRLDALIDS